MYGEPTVDKNSVDNDPRWYLRGIWPLVIAIPALTVVAGLTTVGIANYKADPIIEDAVRPDIAAMHADPRPDAEAVGRGLSAALSTADNRLLVELRGAPGVTPPSLTISFVHATRETYDERATARETASGVYEAPAPALGTGPWYIEAAPAGRDWRLVGRMAGDGTARLAPFGAP